MDEGTFVLDYLSPPGTSFEETSRILRTVEEILRSTPEVENYGLRTGTQLGFFITEPNSGDILVKLKPKRERSIFAVMDEIRNRIEAAQPALEIEFGQQMQDVIGDLTNNPSPVEIKVFGENKEQIETVARRVAQIITPIRGVEDVYDGITISGPSIAMHVDAAKAARVGLTVSDVEAQLENVVRGRSESSIVRGERLIGVRTRFGDAVRNDLPTLRGLVLHAPGGFPVALADLATITTTKGQSEIQRENLKPVVSVTARISGRDLGSTIAEIQHTLKANLALPKGISLAYGGTWQTQQESFRGLLRVLLMAVLFVFIVLLFEFESFRVPITVFLINLPALFGVVFALWVTHVTFNVSSFVGTILVIGIVAENSIFLLHYVVRYRRQGMPLDAALAQAGLIRARPILMTTFAAVFALLPLAIGVGSGTHMQQPLAIAVIGGFSVSTLLLLFALPMLYGLVHRD
jgi:multidrug efflux pump subunit AcrB